MRRSQEGESTHLSPDHHVLVWLVSAHKREEHPIPAVSPLPEQGVHWGPCCYVRGKMGISVGLEFSISGFFPSLFPNSVFVTPLG